MAPSSGTLKGHGNEANFPRFLHRSVWHRSLTLHFKPFQFWLQILGDIRNWKTNLWLSESGNHRLSNSASLGVPILWFHESGSRRFSDSASQGIADSPIWLFGVSAIECLKDNSPHRWVVDSDARRDGVSATPQRGELGSWRLNDSPNRGVAMVSWGAAIQNV